MFFLIWRKRFFDPAVVVKVDTFSDRQERVKASLGRSSGQLKVIQKVRSLKEIEEEGKGPRGFPEYESPDRNSNSTDFVQLERFVDVIQGGIEVSATSRQEVDEDGSSLST